MADKSLGQVAYEAWAQALPRETCDDRAAWQAAAEAVIAHHYVEDPNLLMTYMAHMKENEAVIEAAKAFIAKSENTILVPWHDLRRAVEALQEAEGE